MKPKLKTPISYYGGKQALLHYLLPLVPDHEIYCEPFFGGGALFFAKEPVKNETINDRLDVVINFYRILKTDFRALKSLIDQTLYSRSQHRQANLIIKNRSLYSSVDLAWAFWMLTNFSFENKINGGIKQAKDKKTKIADQVIRKKKDFTELLVKRIENTFIENDDAIKVLKAKNHIKAFHYVDPPYLYCDQGHYAGYKESDFIDLLELLQTIKGKFLLSNFNSRILDNYIGRNGWHKKEIIINVKPMSIRGNVKTEVLVWNYDMEGLFS